MLNSYFLISPHKLTFVKYCFVNKFGGEHCFPLRFSTHDNFLLQVLSIFREEPSSFFICSVIFFHPLCVHIRQLCLNVEAKMKGQLRGNYLAFSGQKSFEGDRRDWPTSPPTPNRTLVKSERNYGLARSHCKTRLSPLSILTGATWCC